jgi:putative intracellular protease/amidase
MIKPIMRRKTCYVFLSEQYADWEIALVMAGLHSFGGVEVITFSLLKEPVSSMGNLAVLADLSLAEVDPEDVDLLVLPGSPLWEKGENQEIADLVRNLYLLDKGIAAVSGAALFLASEGFADGEVISDEGVYGFGFAVGIFDYLGLGDNPQFQQWFQYFIRGEEVMKRSRALSRFFVS